MSTAEAIRAVLEMRCPNELTTWHGALYRIEVWVMSSPEAHAKAGCSDAHKEAYERQVCVRCSCCGITIATPERAIALAEAEEGK